MFWSVLLWYCTYENKYTQAGYVMQINDDEFIDASNSDLSGYARYLNHAKAKANVATFKAQV